jgi:drug/metabolite transporter (DMT)-like permease
MGFFFFSESLSARILAGGFMIIISIIGTSALRNKTVEIVTSDE